MGWGDGGVDGVLEGGEEEVLEVGWGNGALGGNGKYCICVISRLCRYGHRERQDFKSTP